RTSDGNGSHWSTSKTPSYTKSVSWQHHPSYPVHQKQKLTDAGFKLMATAKMPDALRLSGLRHLCNILNLRAFVGRIRRSRRIRHE
ncbi:hypothetical protein SNB01_03860, partial [Escherichia coli]|nr:hypothetical protein [Escherichia coli]